MQICHSKAISCEKDTEVFDVDSLFRKAYYELPLTEQHIILLVLIKMSPRDNPECEYEIPFRDLQGIFDAEDNDSYANFKLWIQQLTNKSWQLIQNDCKTTIRWFGTLRVTKNTGKVIVRLHNGIFPYALKLARQIHSNSNTVE